MIQLVFALLVVFFVAGWNYEHNDLYITYFEQRTLQIGEKYEFRRILLLLKKLVKIILHAGSA